MYLIVDSGSTKTDWSICEQEALLKTIHTQGINPCHQDEETINMILVAELLPEMKDIAPQQIDRIHYYGAGCATATICDEMKGLLGNFFTNATVTVNSDMLGAARALCGHSEGIACVLGTGSNSCMYDGDRIIDQIPSLGYILGDEGSSAAIGRRLISDCLKRQLPQDVADEFMQKYNLTTDSIIENVYRKPMANRYMAGFAPFLEEKRDIPEVHKMLVSCFQEFFRRNVMNYHRAWLPVNFVGSLAATFSAELSEAAESLGLSVGTILKSPMEGLVAYHNFHQ